MVRLSKSLLAAIQISRFSDDTRIPVRAICEMIALALRSARAWERWANTGCSRSERAYNRDRAAIRDIAARHGAKVSWPGLWPLISVDGRDYSLPSI